MTLQREEIIPGPVSCFSPSWTICWHFWSWWLPFEPCGGYLKAQPCELTSEGVTFCLLKVAQRDFTFSDRTWQMLHNENSSLAGFEFSTFTGLHDSFSFLAMHQSHFDGDCSITGCFSLDYSLLMLDWLAKFLPNPGSETHVWSNSKESETDLFILEFCLQPVNWWINKKCRKYLEGYFLGVYNKKVPQQSQISITSSML